MDELTRIAHAARLGDAGALEAFIQASYGEVWRLCAALVDERAADDLAQETFLRALRGLRRFRGEASARTWILAVARHTCMDELRARTRRRRREQRLAASSTPDSVAPDPSNPVGAYDLLAHLEPDRRAAFILTQLFRLPYEQAAIVCDCSREAIRSRVARARHDLIAMLDDTQIPNRRTND